jgi:hypothetical protein
MTFMSLSVTGGMVAFSLGQDVIDKSTSVIGLEIVLLIDEGNEPVSRRSAAE